MTKQELKKKRSKIVEDYLLKNRKGVMDIIKEIGISSNTYYSFLEGADVTLGTLYKISDVLKVDPRELK